MDYHLTKIAKEVKSFFFNAISLLVSLMPLYLSNNGLGTGGAVALWDGHNALPTHVSVKVAKHGL